ncbi:hypothetical protein A7K91_04650 [Paenibacillus oryzae]|uniref:Uncharacterized protein n=1 Tax=Paenibacillus oryzae TaxID=1844972 RepID=A0A1A5YHJ6_9BACL|nr:hypothetical protein [Paenibacillus oryzae]OBR64875.1 hypothetical protein A7K91_04650 [Paenibacillus oryzae]
MPDSETRREHAPDNKELLERVKSLEAEVERLRSHSNTESSFWSRAILAFVIVFGVMLVGIGVVNYLI